MKTKLTFFVPLVILLLIFSSDDPAKLKVNGSEADRNRLKEKLQKGAFGEAMPPPGQVQIDSAGNVTITGNPTNTFGTKLKEIIDDTVNCVELFLERTVPDGRKVTIGGWRRGQGADSTGNGKQSIDLDDIDKAPDADTLGVSTQQAMILHELWEAYTGIRDSIGYGKKLVDTVVVPGAHCKAIEVEQDVIKEQNNGREYHRVRSLFRGRYLYLYFHCIDTTVYRRLRLCFTPTGEIEDITPGFVSRYTRQFITNGPSTGGIQYFNDTHGTIEPGVFDNTFEFQGFNYILPDHNNNYFVSLPTAAVVLRVAKNGNVLTTFQHPDLTAPQGIAYNKANGELYAADEGSGYIVVFDSLGNHLRTLNNIAFNIPAGLDLDEYGNLFVSGHGTDSIYHITPMGEMLNAFGHMELSGPAGIDYSEVSRLLFVVSNTNNKVMSFFPDGTLNAVFPSGTELASPWGIAIEGGTNHLPMTMGWANIPIERIIVASTGTGSLVSYMPNGQVDRIYTTPGISPIAVALDLDTDEQDITSVGDGSTGSLPVDYALYQNFPNPFNPATTIKYTIPESGPVSLKIYDILGREVRTLIQTEQAAGSYELKFNASELSSGIYFYRLEANDFASVKKMMLLK